MRYYTHVPGAILFYLVFAYLVGLSNPILGVVVAAGMAMFPAVVEKVSEKYRALAHSLIWVVPLAFFAFSNVLLSVALIIGFFSHLFLDIFTIRGCPFLYPFKEKNFTCLHHKRRILPGSNQDKVLFILIMMLMVPLLLVTFNLLTPIENSLGFAYADGEALNTTDTTQGDVNINLNLNNASNKNVTVQRSENVTNILVTDIEVKNESG